MGAKIIINDREHGVASGTTVGEAVRSLGMAPDTFLFMTEKRPIPMDTLLTDDSVIRAIKVASGG